MTASRTLTVFALVLSLWVLAGCGGKDAGSQQGGGNPNPPDSKPGGTPSAGPTKLTKENADKIIRGVSTLADVKKLLGEPKTSKGTVHTWEEGDRKITVTLQIDPITQLQTVSKVEPQGVE